MTMNNTLSKIIVFVAGAAVGSVATWKILEKKYDQRFQEELDSVKEAYSNRSSEEESEDDEEEEELDDVEAELEEYADLIEEAGYSEESNDTIQNGNKEEKAMANKPYVISPEEFAESENECITLKYYTNGVIVDEFGGVIEEDYVPKMIGEDFASHFGDYDYDPDTVYMRNEKFGIDYEILKQLEDYTEEA